MRRLGSPDYKRIYNDIVREKYPEKKELCKSILEKKELSFLDIIKLNSLLFGEKNKERSVANQRHKSYDISTIREILDYQKKNRLNNTQLAIHFKLSRNTIARWKRLLSSNNLNVAAMRILK
ncbi:helix-turn-helix domain-containing protein [Chryseobacterium sp. L7]|uniref:Helix-turn-helix domain-containing protein n=1 Tax=Chryseobacterium endalhagicum TaxID=2797638 RepID=A0ABS1QDD4_9FLAO|nr:helix-turn-helix domain-containing protein [Chryseobacterium endalhagicum]MBL1220612.1 helix-turn-helix domain-containing protein [Chryseobacterium endalhagicum]